jgi:hypothetical protein
MCIAFQRVIPGRAKREAGISTRPFMSGFRVHAAGVPWNDE